MDYKVDIGDAQMREPMQVEIGEAEMRPPYRAEIGDAQMHQPLGTFGDSQAPQQGGDLVSMLRQLLGLEDASQPRVESMADLFEPAPLNEDESLTPFTTVKSK
jgi:hypothetical protein